VRLKTRKRNIVVPNDPQAFADAVIDVITDAFEEAGGDVAKTLDAANKVLDGAELDFSRYGEVLFEVAFAGARLASGGASAADAAKRKAPLCILAAPAGRKGVVPYVRWFQAMIRRRPFLVKALEETLIKLEMSLEFYDEAARRTIAVAAARCFAQKVGVLPERVLPAVLQDRLVARGTAAAFATDFFADFLGTESLEALMELLRKARMSDRLLELFPQQRRSWDAFEAHFAAAGLPALVEHTKRKRLETAAAELRAAVGAAAADEPPATPAELFDAVKQRAAAAELADGDVARAAFLGLVDAAAGVPGRNAQQLQLAVLRALKAHAKLLAAHTGSARLELDLLNCAQTACYEDSRLLKLFADVAKVLYDADVVGEDTIKHWAAKGSLPKGRVVFLKDMAPLLAWLDEAEEEEDE
jgi:hypothetical protein